MKAKFFRLLVWLAAALNLGLAWSAAPPELDELEIPEGYEYQGRVKFTTKRYPVSPTYDLAQRSVPRNLSKPLYSILVTSSGHKFTKRLPSIQEDHLDDMLFKAMQPDEYALYQAAARKARRLAATAATTSPSPAFTTTSTSSPGTVSVEEVTSSATGSTAAVDSRTRVASSSTYPFSATGMLLGEEGTSNEYLQCTGALLDSAHILTAAHCVWNIEATSSADRTYVSTLNFYPGMNGGSLSSNGLGTYTWHSVKVLSEFTDQTTYNTEATNYDFALITLKSAANPATGSFGLFRPPTSGTATITLTTAGYPGDKTPSYSMWTTSCSGNTFTYTSNLAASSDCESASCQNWVAHNCYSYNGQSGSPMWDSSVDIRAVLTGEATLSSSGGTVTSGIATSIDAFTYNTIAAWFTEDNSTTAYTPVSASASNWPFWAWIAIGVGGLVIILVTISTIIACCCRSRPDPMAVHPPQKHYQGHHGKGSQGRGGYPIGAFAVNAGRQPPPGYPGGSRHPAVPTAYPPSIGYPQPQYPTGYTSSPMGPPPPGNFRVKIVKIYF
ncbi:hypothetical protein WJX84_002553 [Apatococcus fuscideae]|uniref:Serine protease n=1 Tax=Apatococcus fuscideae TaxID=2026836 RepID=A0AAW1STJ8_9CHLO